MKGNTTGSLLLFVLFAVFPFSLYAVNTKSAGLLQQVALQNIEVVGSVRDSSGTMLAGVSVSVKNRTDIGTTTDLNGRYILAGIPQGAVLVFTMVGFETQEFTLTEAVKQEVNVILKEALKAMDDVVVTAFGGRTRRTDMIGSVTSVSPQDLKVPSSNLTTALAGRVAGMIAYQRSGEPGLDNADFFIRGVTTFGYKVDPLILIDNVEVTTTELARLNVDDIAAFSILKDATATSLYGARGANGVILISTKQGYDGKTALDLRLENSISAPTRNVELADPVTYMKLHNEAILTRNSGGQILYLPEQIDNTGKPGSDPYLYPAVDWRKELLKEYTSNQRAHLNVRGGGAKANYFVSGAVNQDNGLLKVPKENNFNNNISLTSYSLRSNVNMNLTKSTQLTVRLSGNFDDYSGPLQGGAETYAMIMRANPVRFAPRYPAGSAQRGIKHILFGNDENMSSVNPYAQTVRGYREYSRSVMLAQLELRQGLDFLVEGLSFRSMMNTTRNSYFDMRRSYNPFYYHLLGVNKTTGEYILEPLNAATGTEYLDYDPANGSKTLSTVFYMENALNYSRVFNNVHSVSGMLVGVMRQLLNANAGNLQLSLPFRNNGVSGRATYAYDSRYYAEFNFGYNGSERFHKDNRYGFFPSVGVAWTVSNEKFWDPLKNVLSNFRLRGTYGVVGNDAVGSPQDRFLYLSEVNMNAGDRGATFGEERTNTKTGIRMDRYANPMITWERAYKTNIALELGLFNKVQIMADYFTEQRKNIYMNREDIPSTMGLAAPISANIGAAKASGIDFSVDYNHNFGNDMWLQARGNFTYATARYTAYEEPLYLNTPWMSRVGHKLRQEWGYIAERLFIDDEEVANSPEQLFGGQIVRGGDIKFRDINGDGRISEFDRVPIGNPTVPEIVYGFGFSAGIKSIDLSVFFQGLTNESFWIDPSATAPFISSRQLLAAYANDHWSEDNQNVYALWPRLSDVAISNNQHRSTWFMRDGTFLRLKQAEIGYTLSKALTKKVRMSALRIYLGGTNLLTFSRFKLWDVEMAGNGLGYPIQRVFNIGIKASF